jgi:hypothetical protein
MRRAMREREANLERKNKNKSKSSTHQQVNKDIYQDMGAASINGQSDLDDNVLLDDAASILSGEEEEFSCLFDRDRFCGAMNFGDMADDIDFTTQREGEGKHPFSPPMIDKGEVFDWKMPFENIGEDMKSVHRDIVRMGKDILQKGGEYRRKSNSKSSKSRVGE